MNLNLKGKRALVCGSTQGIGKATAMELAEMGAEVVLLARNESSLQNVVLELDNFAGQQHQYIAADFSNPEYVADKVRNFIGLNGGFHILVNNAGGPPGGKLISAGLSEFDDALTMHLKVSHLLVQQVVPFMRDIEYGRIVNIISTSVKIPIPGLGVSNTVRGAMGNWSKTLSFELGGDGITVNNVLPGFTETDRLQQIIDNKVSKLDKAEEEIVAAMKKETPANRFATPEEVAAVVAFLCSPAAGYVNGTSIPVDGGRTGSL